MSLAASPAGANAPAGEPPFPSFLRAAASRIAASPWARPGLKMLGVLLALLVLSAIGGSAIAGAKRPADAPGTSVARAIEDDAGAHEPPIVALAETVIEVPRADAGVPSPLAATAAPPSTGRATPESPVTLNTATLEDLRRLPGIGPKKAEAILALRTKLGKFRRAEDLLRVKGIGRGTFKKLKPLVRLDEPEKSP